MNFDYLTSWFSSILSTNPGKSTGRLKTDDQPTSYEENRQFKIFRRFIDVPTTQQMVFKFEASAPCNIMERKINIWAGGREYLVIPYDSGNTEHTAIDALFDENTVVDITSVNGYLGDSGLAEHPASQVTINYVTGAGLITVDNAFGSESQYPNGDAVQTDSNANRANNALLATPNMSGLDAGQAFFLLFRNISQSTATSGHFYLQWEEITD